MKWLNKEDGYKTTFEYGEVMKNKLSHQTSMTDLDGLSIAMRLLIHYCGDIHQPLHAADRVNKEYPRGDYGGNAFLIPNTTAHGPRSLHSVWDSVLFEFMGWANIPYNDHDWQELGQISKKLTDEYPMTDDIVKDLDPVHWAKQSAEIG